MNADAQVIFNELMCSLYIILTYLLIEAQNGESSH